MTRGARTYDAVCTEAGVRCEKTAFLFAQRYKQMKSGSLAKVGKSAVVAEVAHLGADREAVLDQPRQSVRGSSG
jgi:hypothetical protein